MNVDSTPHLRWTMRFKITFYTLSLFFPLRLSVQAITFTQGHLPVNALVLTHPGSRRSNPNKQRCRRHDHAGV